MTKHSTAYVQQQDQLISDMLNSSVAQGITVKGSSNILTVTKNEYSEEINMNLYSWYRDWKKDCEEEKKFNEFWDKACPYFKKSDEDFRSYHRSIAYEIHKLRNEIENLKEQIKK